MAGEEAGVFAGYRFSDANLLRQALTHRSHSQPHNERLEFVGDGVLDCIIALELYRRFPLLPEGELSRRRAGLVNQATLAAVAARLDLGSHLRLGEGEARSGGASRPSILADALEALLGAVFLDGGFTAAESVALAVFSTELDQVDASACGKDPKTALQEWLQARRMALPVYTVTATRGSAHEQQFDVQCRLDSLGILATGTGTSRRAAEQAAARAAFDQAVGP